MHPASVQRGEKEMAMENEAKLPAGDYRPRQVIKYDGREWFVLAVAHTGKYVRAKTCDGGRYREQTIYTDKE